jgi:hypothetical protein
MKDDQKEGGDPCDGLRTCTVMLREGHGSALPSKFFPVTAFDEPATRRAALVICPPLARVSAFSLEDSALRGIAMRVLTAESAVFDDCLRAYFFGIMPMMAKRSR